MKFFYLCFVLLAIGCVRENVDNGVTDRAGRNSEEVAEEAREKSEFDYYSKKADRNVNSARYNKRNSRRGR